MVMLSAKGITEITPRDESDFTPFNLCDNAAPSFDADTAIYVNTRDLPPVSGRAPDLLATLRQWAQMQRDSYEYLVKAFADVPAGLSVVTSSGPTLVAPQQFPDDLLSKPLENILVSDERLGIPRGCVTVLEQAGICSVSMLLLKMTSGELTKIPRVGKAKAAVIRETLRAFEAARKSRESGD